jgi:hypothetical protein
MNWEPSEGIDEWPGCLGCAHRRVGKRLWCAAYPEGIPFIIIAGQVDHLVPRPGQVGKTVYEPLDLQHWLKTKERRVLAEEGEPATRS